MGGGRQNILPACHFPWCIWISKSLHWSKWPGSASRYEAASPGITMSIRPQQWNGGSHTLRRDGCRTMLIHQHMSRTKLHLVGPAVAQPMEDPHGSSLTKRIAVGGIAHTPYIERANRMQRPTLPLGTCPNTMAWGICGPHGRSLSHGNRNITQLCEIIGATSPGQGSTAPCPRPLKHNTPTHKLTYGAPAKAVP